MREKKIVNLTMACSVQHHIICAVGSCNCDCHKDIEFRTMGTDGDEIAFIREFLFEVWSARNNKNLTNPMIRYTLEEVISITESNITREMMDKIVEASINIKEEDEWSDDFCDALIN